MKALFLGLVLAALGVGFALGRAGMPSGNGAQAAPVATFQRVQADPRELLPLAPGPGDGPGQQQGQQSGQGQPPQQGGCTVLMMQDGQLYQLQPGQQPGQRPGSGDGPGNGTPGGDELIPLQPFNGPSPIPGWPVPGGPVTPAPEVKA